MPFLNLCSFLIIYVVFNALLHILRPYLCSFWAIFNHFMITFMQFSDSLSASPRHSFTISSQNLPHPLPFISPTAACSALGLQAKDKDVLQKSTRPIACSPQGLQAARHQQEEVRRSKTAQKDKNDLQNLHKGQAKIHKKIGKTT